MKPRPGPDSGTVRVLVIGAGPTGLTAATLLAQYGIDCLLLDRRPSIYPQPRAVHLDDEVYRILARLGVAGQFAAISRPGHGLRLLDRAMRPLAEFQRPSGPGRHGYPAANMFDQPELEGILRANLKQYNQVELRAGAQVTALDQDGEGVRAHYNEAASGKSSTVRARYVLGCDGANSLTRTAIAAQMRDLGFAQRWLVVDIATDADLHQWDGVHQVCDPHRAATFMRIGATRYRWEFRLAPGESAEDYRRLERLHPLIAPWTRDVPSERLELIRVADYTFRAQIAERWRDRRIFLLGDAAHLTPPFIGQGMGAGLRDAMNLAWKLAGVFTGSLPEPVLDTYEAERKPHARAMIRLAKAVGTAMTDGGRTGNLLRGLLAPRLHHLPGISDLILDSRTPALHRSQLVARPRLGRTLAGSLCPNAPLSDDGRRLDDLAAGRFMLVTTLDLSGPQRDAVAHRGALVHTARQGSALYDWLSAGRALAALIRPDGTVMRTSRTIDALLNSLPSGTLSRPRAESSV